MNNTWFVVSVALIVGCGGETPVEKKEPATAAAKEGAELTGAVGDGGTPSATAAQVEEGTYVLTYPVKIDDKDARVVRGMVRAYRVKDSNTVNEFWVLPLQGLGKYPLGNDMDAGAHTPFRLTKVAGKPEAAVPRQEELWGECSSLIGMASGLTGHIQGYFGCWHSVTTSNAASDDLCKGGGAERPLDHLKDFNVTTSSGESVGKLLNVKSSEGKGVADEVWNTTGKYTLPLFDAENSAWTDVVSVDFSPNTPEMNSYGIDCTVDVSKVCNADKGTPCVTATVTQIVPDPGQGTPPPAGMTTPPSASSLSPTP